MTSSVNSSSDCARAWEAMPWVLQGSSAQEQHEWLMDHVAHCESCSAEFAQQSRLRVALSLPADVEVDAAAGLKRLLSRVDTSDSHVEPSARVRSGRWLPIAVAAALAFQVLGFGALGVKWWFDGTPQYHTLSQSAAPAPANAIRVVPDAGMKLADWNNLLHTLRLKVIGGPNDVGAYTLVPTGSGPDTAHVVQKLRATRGIRMAEPVDDSP